MADPRGDYYFRTNSDGSTEAICLNCFLTVASNVKNFGIEDLDRTHQCGKKLELLQGRKKRSAELDNHLPFLLTKFKKSKA